MQDRVGVIEELAREIADSYFVDTYEAIDCYGSDYSEALTGEIESDLWDENLRKDLIIHFKKMLEEVDAPDSLVTKHANIIRRMEAL